MHMNGLMPPWWHRHGDKIILEVLNVERKFLLLASEFAQLKVQKADNAESWYLEWSVRHTHGATQGWCIWTTDCLQAAFGLSADVGCPELFWQRDFYCHAAVPGSYIRWENNLNIPNPGTGVDGDSNISIYIDQQIQKAVSLLVGIPLIVA